MAPSRALAARNMYGNICRHHPDDPQKQAEARADLAEAKIVDFVEKELSRAPALGPDRLARIAALLNAGRA